jgi:hypothetical protein
MKADLELVLDPVLTGDGPGLRVEALGTGVRRSW